MAKTPLKDVKKAVTPTPAPPRYTPPGIEREREDIPPMFDLAKRGRGAPPKIVDGPDTRRLFTFLGNIQATYDDCAAAFGCASGQTISNFFRNHPEVKEVYESAIGQGRVSLRLTQFRLSRTNPAMAIWLGKQLLGQKDNPALGEGSAAIADSNDAKAKLERAFNSEFAARSGETTDKRLN